MPLSSSSSPKHIDIIPSTTLVASTTSTQIRKLQVWRRMRYLTGMAAIGGFLFGYDTGVVSGAMLPLKRRFDLTSTQQEMIVSSTVFAAFVSSLCVGASLNDKFGRRWAILFSAAVFGLGSLILLCAFDFTSLVIGRIILGLGIGVASLTTPVYLAEMAVPRMRGQLVTINTLMITFGQFFAGMIDGVFDQWMPGSGWRFMLGLAGVPSLIMFIGFLNLPESPRWLAGKGRMREAALVLMELRETRQEAEVELTEIVMAIPTTQSPHSSTEKDINMNFADELTSLASSNSSSASPYSLKYGSDTSLESRGSVDDVDENDGDDSASNIWGLPRLPSQRISKHNRISSDFSQQNSLRQLYIMLSHAPTRRALVLGCGLMAVQQCSGINTVMYYAASIYEMSGFEEVTAVWLSGFTALAQVVGIAASIFLVDKAGRRTLVLFSLAFVTLSLAGLATSFYLSRITSGNIEVALGDCQHQPAMIWDGITTYCYDCTSIPGCSYCNGACVPSDSTGSSDVADFCKADDGESWQVDSCSHGKDDDDNIKNPFGIMSVVFMVLYLLAFGIGMGGMPWTINSEIYPMQFRSLAVSLSTATNWIGNLVVSATFLSLSSPTVLTAYGAFGLYGLVALVGLSWLCYALPETKSLSLEEIEELFRRPGDTAVVPEDHPNTKKVLDIVPGDINESEAETLLYHSR